MKYNKPSKLLAGIRNFLLKYVAYHNFLMSSFLHTVVRNNWKSRAAMRWHKTIKTQVSHWFHICTLPWEYQELGFLRNTSPTQRLRHHPPLMSHGRNKQSLRPPGPSQPQVPKGHIQLSVHERPSRSSPHTHAAAAAAGDPLEGQTQRSPDTSALVQVHLPPSPYLKLPPPCPLQFSPLLTFLKFYFSNFSHNLMIFRSQCFYTVWKKPWLISHIIPPNRASKKCTLLIFLWLRRLPKHSHLVKIKQEERLRGSTMAGNSTPVYFRVPSGGRAQLMLQPSAAPGARAEQPAPPGTAVSTPAMLGSPALHTHLQPLCLFLPKALSFTPPLKKFE